MRSMSPIWGMRSFNGAAALTLRKLVAIPEAGVGRHPLQWGRSVNAAETWSPPTQGTPSTCFNGAAALTLRKRGGGGGFHASPLGFNGAAALTLRKRGYPRPGPPTPESFNGAAALTLRKRYRGHPYLRLGSGFNGAAALTLRKLEPTQGGCPVRPASMGPQR